MKTLFILGGNGDIGSAIVKKFKKEKYHIISPSSKEMDLANRESIDKYFAKHKIKADVIIQCAGYNRPKPFEEISYEELDKTLAINTLSFYQVLQYLLKPLKKQKEGHILGISSIYGFLSRKGRLSYSMSKHALIGLVKTLALELGAYNIKVNALSPGFVATKMTVQNNTPAIIKDFEEKIALGRLANTEEIAELAYFLCSSQNSYITGQNIVIDGGYSIGGFQK